MATSPHANRGGQQADTIANLEPRCLATTGDAFSGNAHKGGNQQPHSRSDSARNAESNFFKDARFSADGTCVVTHNEDQCLRTFILPTDLLDEENQPHTLAHHSVIPAPAVVQSYALYPSFNLHDSTTTLILSSTSDLPLRLTNALDAGYVHAKYLHVNPTTEAWIAPNSLAFVHGGSQFAAGSQGLVAIFDTASDGSGPIITHKTKPRNPRAAARSMHDNSKVMALSLSPDGFLAAGTSGRSVGIFSGSGHGQCETSFSLASGISDKQVREGSGVTSLGWTPDGLYLLVAERQSDGIHVYDVRNQLCRLAWLSGRKADTTQRMGIDVVPTASGCEIWAGGTDGHVRMWNNPGLIQGEQLPDAELKMHEDAVSSAVWHPGGAVLATCSGQRYIEELPFDGEDPDSGDSHVKGLSESSSSEEDSNATSDDSSSDADMVEVSLPRQPNRTVAVARGSGRPQRVPDNKLKIWTV